MTTNSLSLSQIQRFKTVLQRVDSTMFPFEHPPGSMMPLLCFDKFLKKDVPYTPEEVRPPARLYFHGGCVGAVNSPLSVGFAGTSSATRDAMYMTAVLAQATVRHGSIRGIHAVVVSGGAVGVDMAAHLGALDAGGLTIAVVANGVSFGLDPLGPSRAFLETAIVSHGALVSEHDDCVEFGADFQKRLLQRDRIITALSDLFFVVESKPGSATVDTAKRAYIQGKRVYAIDWSQVLDLWANPKTGGNQELFDAKIAERFPARPVSLMGAAELFDQLLDQRLELA